MPVVSILEPIGYKDFHAAGPAALNHATARGGVCTDIRSDGGVALCFSFPDHLAAEAAAIDSPVFVTAVIDAELLAGTTTPAGRFASGLASFVGEAEYEKATRVPRREVNGACYADLVAAGDSAGCWWLLFDAAVACSAQLAAEDDA